MENLELGNLFGGVYTGKKVLVTGHTGFKGSWLSFWLIHMGAEVYGYSDRHVSEPSHFELLRLDGHTNSMLGDINDYSQFHEFAQAADPDAIFHLAAQPLVRYSYQNPLETFLTNIIGSANVLNSARSLSNLRAAVMVTSDKCYNNLEENRPFLETDPMGGRDPYSASKGASELIISSFRDSYFNMDNHGEGHRVIICTARAGNVIGGGDWAQDRLIPDTIRKTALQESILIRNPKAKRPWQHVLEPLSGYLRLGQMLLANNKGCSGAWNFGPNDKLSLSVQEILTMARQHWEKISYAEIASGNNLYEAKSLSLNSDKANKVLNWRPVWSTNEAVGYTIRWYKNYYNNGLINTKEDLESYISDARALQLSWTN